MHKSDNSKWWEYSDKILKYPSVRKDYNKEKVMLRDVYKDIIADIKDSDEFYKTNMNIFKCMRGDQLSVLKNAFKKTSSPLARQDKMDLAVSLNFIQKIVNKLSQIYTFDVARNATSNQDLVEHYEKSMTVDTVMQNANELFNGMKSCLVEIYIKKDKTLGLRPIPSDRFFVWTNDVLDPTIPSVYVKFVGTCRDKTYKNKKHDLFFAYTDTEFLAFDSSGQIHEEYSTENDINELGTAPFVYINKDIYDIMPTPNKDMLQNVIQICSIMTDANVANYYQSFPIRVLINADMDNTNIDINPNSVIVLNSKMGEQQAPDFKEVSSTLDTSKSINLAKEILQNLLYIFDVQSEGAMDSSSGFALTIKATDTLENRKKQIEYFKPAEQTQLWPKIAIIHNTLVKKNALSPKAPKMLFNEDFSVELVYELPSTENEQSKDQKGTGETPDASVSQDAVNKSKDENTIETDEKPAADKLE